MASTLEYYRDLILGMLYPGATTRRPTSILGSLAETVGKVLQEAVDVAAQLRKEIFPHSAEQTLGEWEQSFGEPIAAGATQASRQAALVGRWRAQQPMTPRGIRDILADVLNPTHFFRDPLDDASISWRFRAVDNNGSATEDTSKLQLALSTVDGRWDATNKLPVLRLIDIPDIEDDWTLEVHLKADGLVADVCAGGAVAYLDDDNAIMAGAWRDSGATRIRWGHLLKNVATLPADGATGGAIAYSEWVVIERVGTTYTIKTGDTLGSLTDLGSIETTIVFRELGVFLFNAAADPATIDIETIQARQLLKRNNVELIELAAGDLTATEIAAGDLFNGFVHRDPADAGTYSIANAQRLADKAKPAHTLLMVGESDNFLTDDDFSLTDRDVLGS